MPDKSHIPNLYALTDMMSRLPPHSIDLIDWQAVTNAMGLPKEILRSEAEVKLLRERKAKRMNSWWYKLWRRFIRE